MPPLPEPMSSTIMSRSSSLVGLMNMKMSPVALKTPYTRQKESIFACAVPKLDTGCDQVVLWLG
jgi:hypothetical protein